MMSFELILFLGLFVGFPAAIVGLLLLSPLHVGWAVLTATLVLLFLAMLIPELAAIFAAVLTMYAVWRSAWFHRHSRAVKVAGSCGMLVLFCLFSWKIGWNRNTPRLRERAELREQYPIESLEARLAWQDEPRVTDGARRAAVVAPVPLSSTVEAGLQEMEDPRWSYSGIRQSALEQIHNDRIDEFLAAPGFGVVRMRYYGRHTVLLPEPRTVPLPEPPPARPATSFGNKDDGNESTELVENAADQPDTLSDGEKTAADAVPPAGEQLATALINMYRNGLADFIDPDQIGYVPEPRKAAGFQPHSVDFLPGIGDAAQTNTSAYRQFRANSAMPADVNLKEGWRITRLELVSLLRHAEPVVYTSRELPRMDRLAEAPTRPLTPFERRSLRQLRGRQDLVTSENNGHVLMLGAVRAGKQCLKCHEVRRGTLLGAFSYEIWLPGAAPVKPAAEEQGPST